jgi:hypothetical protein
MDIKTVEYISCTVSELFSLCCFGGEFLYLHLSIDMLKDHGAVYTVVS